MNALKRSREGQVWLIYLNLLQEYAWREGNCKVPIAHMEKTIALGQWVHRQRVYGSTLSEEQRDALEGIDGWYWEKEGDRKDAPRNGTTGSQPGRASVVGINATPGKEQKYDKRIETKGIIEKSRAGSTDDVWQIHYRLLLKYMNREGHCQVPKSHLEDGFRLGLWVIGQRQNRESMSQKMRKLLDSLNGWTWNVAGEQWEEFYRLLEQYCEREGTAAVPWNHIEEGKPLGRWVGNQKIKQRRGTISMEAKTILELLPGWRWASTE